MAETKPIPVRLSPELIARLDGAAQQMSTTRAGIIKLCLNAFLDAYERDGEVALPLNWRRVLEKLDGRTVHARSLRGDSPGSHAWAPGAGSNPETPEDELSSPKTLAGAVAHAVIADGIRKLRTAKPSRRREEGGGPGGKGLRGSGSRSSPDANTAGNVGA